MADSVTTIPRITEIDNQSITRNIQQQLQVNTQSHINFQLGLPPNFSPTYDSRIGNVFENEFFLILLDRDNNSAVKTPTAVFNIRGEVQSVPNDLSRAWALYNLLEEAGTQGYQTLIGGERDFVEPTEQADYFDTDYLGVLSAGEINFDTNYLLLTNRRETTENASRMAGNVTYNFNPMVENISIAEDNYLFIVEKYMFSIEGLRVYHGIPAGSGGSDWSGFASVVTTPTDYPTLDESQYNTFGYTTTGNTGSVNLNVLDIDAWVNIFDSDEFKAITGDREDYYFVLARITPIDRQGLDFGDDGIDITYHQPAEQTRDDKVIRLLEYDERESDANRKLSGRFIGTMIYPVFTASTFLTDLQRALELDVGIVNLRDDIAIKSEES